MSERILVTGKKISSMELVTNITGNEKIPTGQQDDLAITPNQLSDYTIARGSLVNRDDLLQVEGDLGIQITDLANDVTSADNSIRGLIAAEEAARIAADNLLQTSLGEEVSARIAADDLKVDKEGSVSSVAGRVGDVALAPSDVLVEGFGSQEDVNKYVPKPFLSGYTYGLGERVVLANGDIVKSTIDGNVNNPNVNMTGWVEVNAASQIIDASGGSQQSVNDLAGYSRLLFKNYDDLRNHTGLGTRIFISGEWMRGSFVFDESDTSSTDNGGTIIVDSLGRRWKREFSGAVKAYWFGAPTMINDQVQINKAIIAAVGHKELVDLRGAAWRINGTIKFNQNSSGYIANKQSTITVVSSGTYPSGYAVEIGDPATAQPSGRTAGFKCQGHLFVTSTSRANELNGIFIKGSWLNVDFIRAVNFNGYGINVDTVWDSTIGHLSAEVCGNSTTFALRISSSADTFNSSTINTIQCEQSQGRGLGINVLRTTINTIHSERMTVINESDDHNFIMLSNSTLNQAVIDSLTKNETTIIDAPGSVVNSVSCSGDVKSTFGYNHSFSGLVCKNYSQTGAAKDITLNNCRIDTLKVSSGAVVTHCNVKTFDPLFNAEKITVVGGSVTTVHCTSNIRGNICFNGTKIDSINSTREPASGYNQTEFHGCNVGTYQGEWNAQAKFIGGSIQTASIASQAKPTFIDVEFKDFSAVGNRAYITRNCTAIGTVVWATPNFSVRAGTITERIGYSADGKIYQNTDGAANWVKLA